MKTMDAVIHGNIGRLDELDCSDWRYPLAADGGIAALGLHCHVPVRAVQYAVRRDADQQSTLWS